jgi:hypothetical protein
LEGKGCRKSTVAERAQHENLTKNLYNEDVDEKRRKEQEQANRKIVRYDCVLLNVDSVCFPCTSSASEKKMLPDEWKRLKIFFIIKRKVTKVGDLMVHTAVYYTTIENVA